MSCPIPAMPARPAKPLSPLPMLRAARDNAVAIWHQGAFAELLMHRRLPGRDLWILNNPRDLRKVLVEQPDHYTKSPENARPLRPLIGNSLFISEGEDWRLQRRVIAPMLTGPERLLAYESAMIETIGEMLDRWDGLAGGSELEMSWEATRMAAEVISRTLFSYPLGAHARTVYESFDRYQDTLGRLDVMSLLGLPEWMPRPGERRAKNAVARLEGVVEAIIHASRRRGGRHDDLPALLMGEDSPHRERLGPRQLRDEFMLTLLAGHETTANALCWAFYLLALDPRVRSLVESEADRELGDRPPCPGELERLPYTRAVVSEVLRLYPPIYQFSRQARSATALGRQTIKSGSLMVISPWLLHRHRRFWKQPDAFLPERFLEPAGRRQRQCYIPFGTGPRVCPGAGFAMNELTYALAMGARRFRLDLLPGQNVEPLGRLTLRPRHGLRLRLSRR
jgi:cytochrome P450